MYEELQQATPGTQEPAKSDKTTSDFFAQMGKPISQAARQEGFDHCIEMGLDKEMAYRAVNAMAEQLERDKPFEAQREGMKFLDITGVYRLMAVLLTPAT